MQTLARYSKISKIGFILFILFLLPALACNYPTEARRDPQAERFLRQTLAAQLFPTGQPAPSTPDPDLMATALPYMGLATATPGELAAPTPTPQGSPDPSVYLYAAQAGDNLDALASRFKVSPEQIAASQPLPRQGLIDPGTPLIIPNTMGPAPYPSALLPDSEIIYSPSTAGFSISDFIARGGGYLSTYGENVDGEWMTGDQIVARVAAETSTNPRFLLAFLEYRAGWVFGQPPTAEKERYPIGFYVPGYNGLYKELSLAAKQLNIAYYSWRSGTLEEIEFFKGGRARLSPDLNAGTVAVQYLFATLYREIDWQQALYGSGGSFISLYNQMFGDPWARAAAVEPLFPAGISQPPLELPFAPGERWSMTAGPHISWNTGTPRGALDFAPVTGEPPCAVSRAWARAAAPGVVVRAERNAVVLDLDGDGYEQTGWVLFYLHIAQKDQVLPGTRLNQDDPLGHPSCEGGRATGTHIHIARKYNGEWVSADGPLPFVLSGWQAQAGSRPYEGLLVRDGQVVSSNPGGSSSSIIVR